MAKAQGRASKVIAGVLIALLSPVVLAFLVIVAPIIVVAAGYDRARRAQLRRAFARRWGPSGKDVLLVYSDSPHWQRYVEANWLPQIAARAVVLNWSERARWRDCHPLEAAIFRRWAGDREFNPLAIVLPARGPVKVVRFWRAFRDFKHGKPDALRAAERELAELLGISLTVGA
jgi:hypothetical protein